MKMQTKHLLSAARDLLVGLAPDRDIDFYAILTSHGEHLSVTCRAGDIYARIMVPVDDVGEFFQCAVDLRALVSAVKSIREKEITIAMDGGCLALSAGPYSARCRAVPLGPLPDPIAGLEIEFERIFTTIIPPDRVPTLAWVARAMSTDDSRSHLNGLHLGDALVASDGHRLHAWPIAFGAEPVSITVPARAIALALKRAKKYELWIQHDHTGKVVRLLTTSLEIRAITLAGKFPDWRQVVPQWDVAAHVLRGAHNLGAVAESAPKVKDKRLTLTLNGRADASACDADGEVVFTSPIEGAIEHRNHEETEITIGVNAEYLADAIGSLSVDVRFGAVRDPIRIDRPDGTLALIMPIK